MRIFLLAIISCLFFTSCEYNKETENLKSPCVGAVGSPCGPKRPVNKNMMHVYSFKA